MSTWRKVGCCLAVAAGLMFGAQAESYTWKGGTSANFEDAANWEPEGTPGAADAYVIPKPESGETAVTVNTALDIAALTVGGGTGAGTVKLTFANGLTTNVVAGNVNVLSGGKLTHKQNSTAKTYVLNLKVGGDMTIESGAFVDADCCGFKKGGPGGTGNGGAYGGYGWSNSRAPYGSIREPTDLGSNGKESTGAETWAGGGAILLDVTNTLTLDGDIRARGGLSSGTGGGCGGSGGSILLKTGVLSGSGSIDANQSRFNGAYYSGSGGRIALYQRTARDWNAFTGAVRAHGGNFFQTTGAACGTIFKKHAGQEHGDLIVAAHHTSSHDNKKTPIFAAVADGDMTFDSLTVSGWARCEIGAGETLKLTKGINTTDAYLRSADGSAGIELVGTDDFTWRGGSVSTELMSLVCRVPGKKIYFGKESKDLVRLPADANLVLHGDATTPLSLLPLDPAATWKIRVEVATVVDILNVAVSNAVATAESAGINAYNSQNLGGNVKWSFARAAVPGETITWTGLSATDPTDWADGDNWDLKRPVAATDDVVIPTGRTKYPSFGAGNYVLNRLTVEEGASLKLLGTHATVTNELAVHGSLVCTGTERFDISAATVDFTGGSVTPAESDFVINGEVGQTVNLGGCTFNFVNVERAGSVTFTDDFSAKRFAVRPSAALSLTFAAGETVTADALHLEGYVGGESLLTLGSSEPGTAWKLNLTKDVQQVTGVTVSDSDASGGVTIRGGSTSTGTDTANWDFATATASWTGAVSTDFATADNWIPAAVPGADTVVSLTPLRGESVTVVVPANRPTSVKQLILGSGEGTVKFTAQSPITIGEKLEIPAKAMVVLNSAGVPNVVSNDVVIRKDGVLTHDQLKKLNLVVEGDLTIDTGARIDADCKGYGQGKSSTGLPSAFEPYDWGSGGGGSTKIGGGVVKLDVSGTLTVNGAIDACSYGGGNGGGSGVGGSIWLSVGTLAGTGRIWARPLRYGATDYERNWCSTGGRIAVYQRTATDWSAFAGGTMTADGGKRTRDDGGSSPAGTIYRETAADLPRGGEILIRSDHFYGDTLLPLAGDGSVEKKDVYAGVKITVEGGLFGVTNSAWKATVAHTMKIRDIDIRHKDSKVNLRGATLRVRQSDHRDGKNWEAWDKANPTAAYEKHVNEGGGKIVWTQGTVLFVR